MSLKVFQIIVLLTIVALSTQKRSDNEYEHKKLLHTPLKNPGHGSRPIKRQENPNLMNIQTLNLFFKPHADRAKRNNDLTRVCKYGRCHDQESVDSQNQEVNKYEVEQLLDQLEKKLDQLESPDQLRCSDYRCGTLREADERCGCGRNRADGSELDSESDSDSDDGSGLRCRGLRCSKHDQSSVNLKSELERYGKKYKISDDLDAFVLDSSKLDGLLDKLNNDHDRDDIIQSENSKYPSNIKNIDLDYYDSNSRNSKDEDSVTAIVVNLGQVTDDAEALEQVENAFLGDKDDQPVSPNELADFYEFRKQRILNNAENFVKNSRGDKNILNLSRLQKQNLQKLRSQIQRLESSYDDERIRELIKEIILGKAVKSLVLPHNEKTNNVYVPKWLHNAVRQSRSELRNKGMFPLTPKQKQKRLPKPAAFRRNVQQSLQDYGVPFELQVQGLGQVNS